MEEKRRRHTPRWGRALLSCGCLTLLAVFVWACSIGRESARQAICGANVRQLGTCLQMYSADWDDRLPTATTWMDATYTYAKNRSLYTCPAVAVHGFGGYGYAFNAAITGKRMKSISSPDTVVTVYDSTNLAWNAADTMASLPRPGRHRDGNWVGLADGHAKMVPAGGGP